MKYLAGLSAVLCLVMAMVTLSRGQYGTCLIFTGCMLAFVGVIALLTGESK